jgi:dihydrolipoamide dehydrogenase
MQSRLLPEADPALMQPVTRSVTAPFEHVRTNTVLKDAVTESDGIRAILSCKGQTEEQLYSGMLVAIGRRPFTGGLGLEHTAVQTDAKGFIQTDAFGRTAEPHIYAAGDVAGPPMLAHKATHQGLRAAEHLAGIDTPATPCPVPAVVFTSPEIAWAGLTERAARQARRKVKVLRFPWAASGRALASGGTHGSTRLITDPETGIVLGAGITGTHAGELISEAVLAIQQGLHADTLAQVIHPHPTLSETIGEAAALFSGACIHLHGKR